jgi:hypothetical protein
MAKLIGLFSPPIVSAVLPFDRVILSTLSLGTLAYVLSEYFSRQVRPVSDNERRHIQLSLTAGLCSGSAILASQYVPLAPLVARHGLMFAAAAVSGVVVWRHDGNDDELVENDEFGDLPFECKRFVGCCAASCGSALVLSAANGASIRENLVPSAVVAFTVFVGAPLLGGVVKSLLSR